MDALKTIILLLSLLIVCGTANAATLDEDQHYIIAVVVWDNVTGLPEADVPVTFGGIHTLHTADDGSVVYDTANLDDIRHGEYVVVSCKYGTKLTPIILCTYESVLNETSRHSEMQFVQNWGMGITFNEPSESIAIEAFAAMGFAAIAIGGGRYLLRRKKNTDHKGDIMTEETNETTDTRSKLARDFGVRAAIALVGMSAFGIACIVAVNNSDMSMLDDIARVFTPVISVIVLFYFGGSIIRDGLAK